MPDTMKTQMSGKFSKRDRGIFNLKRRLVAAGIEVQFPFSDKIVGEYQGTPVTFMPTADQSFYDVELAFFAAIRTNPVHIVHNKHGRHRGYIGESASIETAYAILHAKPIILLHPPMLSDKVPLSVRKLIEENRKSLFVARIDLFSSDRLIAYVSKVIDGFSGKYDLCDVETEISVMESIAKLFESYRSV
ncbi:MAG: hypothetical protein G01um101438_341 [Parcubacteria group bacterium Gr01-1014_38]|nr:MAG: hypothetical protein G01um101438_341 [Parcubacteria group bacterium Gr01-1014_38]